jgi:hypothetical protein
LQCHVQDVRAAAPREASCNAERLLSATAAKIDVGDEPAPQTIARIGRRLDCINVDQEHGLELQAGDIFRHAEDEALARVAQVRGRLTAGDRQMPIPKASGGDTNKTLL